MWMIRRFVTFQHVVKNALLNDLQFLLTVFCLVPGPLFHLPHGSCCDTSRFLKVAYYCVAFHLSSPACTSCLLLRLPPTHPHDFCYLLPNSLITNNSCNFSNLVVLHVICHDQCLFPVFCFTSHSSSLFLLPTSR